MSIQTRRRTAALLEVLGVYLAGAFLNDAVKQVFTNTTAAACAVLAVAQTIYVIEAHRINGMTQIAIGMLVVALGLEAIDRRENRTVRDAAISAQLILLKV